MASAIKRNSLAHTMKKLSDCERRPGRLAEAQTGRAKAAAKHGTSPPKDEDMSLHLRGAGLDTALRLEEIGKLPYATEDEQLKLKAADKADKDASGEIDIRELGSVAALGKDLRTHELEMMMKQADADGSGTVDFQEFRARWAYGLSLPAGGGLAGGLQGL